MSVLSSLEFLPNAFGSGEYVFEPVGDWLKIPEGWVTRDVSGVAADSKDNIYVFSRGTHPVMVFDRDGNLINHWGDGHFVRPHGAFMGPDDSIWLTDDHDHTVRKCSLDGQILLQLGVRGTPTPFMSGRPFRRPTHCALSPSGDIYVSDGYQNASVHKFSPDGRHIFSFGRPGTDPGEFNVVHNITCDDSGRLYVADRENFRVQVFSPEGEFEMQWHDFFRPAALFTTRGANPVTFVGEGGPQKSVSTSVPNLGARISILDGNGRRLSTLGSWQPGIGPLEFIAPHGITLDSRGDLYVAEVAWTNWPKKFPDIDRPANLTSIRKFRRISQQS